MLPTLLRKGSHEKLQGAIVEDAFSANAGKSALAGVRAFLQSRCGNLKSAFHALDVHSVGQLTSDDFAKGLQRLGYSEDAMPVFHMVDATSSGLISFRSFLRVLGGISPEEEEATNHLLQSSFNSVGHTKSLQRSASEDAWRSARIPRHSSDGQQSRAPSPKHRASVSYIEEFTNPPKSLQVPERPPAPPSSPPPVATAELHARVAWLEEQCSTEQKQRAEMEDSLAQRLHTLVGVSISEQLDLLRQQLIDERAAREAAVAALCHNSEEMRCRNGAEECKSCVTIERVAEDAAKLNSQVEELGFHMNTRLAALEASCASTTMTATPTMPDVLPDTARLQHQIAGLLEQFQTMSQRLDSLESASTHQREQIFGVVEERLANQSSGVTKEVAANLQSRLACLEAAAAPDSALDVTRPSVERSSEHLGLVEKIPTVLQRLDVLEKTHDKEQIRVLSLLEKRSAAPEDADHSKDVGNLLPEVLSHVRGYLGERLESLRAEWKALIDEEHDKSCERAEVLGRTLGHEFERSITAQAIAEACAEARAAVGGMLESWREERGADGHDALSTSRLVKIEEEKRRGIQSALATVRGDLDGLRGRLQELSERAPPRVDEVTDRVTSLEAAFQHVTGTGRSEVEAIATAKTEQLCSGRLTAIDQGLARLSTEVTQQGDGLLAGICYRSSQACRFPRQLAAHRLFASSDKDIKEEVKKRITDVQGARISPVSSDWRKQQGHAVPYRFRLQEKPKNASDKQDVPYADFSGLRFPTLETAENYNYHRDKGLDRLVERAYPIKVPWYRRLNPYLREYIHFLHDLDPARFTVSRIAQRYRLREKTVSKVLQEWGANRYMTRSGLTKLRTKQVTKEEVALTRKEWAYAKWVGYDQMGDEEAAESDDEAIGEFKGWRSTHDWIRRQTVEVEMMSAFPMMEKRDPMPKRVDIDLQVGNNQHHKIINWIDPNDKVVF